MSKTITNNYNFNFTSSNDFSFSSDRFQLPKNGIGKVFDQISSILDRLSQQFDRFDSNQQGLWGGHGGCGCPSKPAPIEPPNFHDSCQPKDSLKTEGNVITTPGGYKIEMQGQFDWKITGPDGKKTEIWGDPHVREGDGGVWDFKKDAIFKLPDGTQIKVNCMPYGSNATVTGSLDITCGNDHIKVSDIDKGIGKIGQNQNDGFMQRYGNDMSGLDKFVMGKESDDWSLGGKEIIGSNNGGDSFKLGNDLEAGRMAPKYDDFATMFRDLMNRLTGGSFANNIGNNNGGFNNPWHQYRKPVDRNPNRDETVRNDTRQEVLGGIRQGLTDLTNAINRLSRLAQLSNRMNGFRNRGFYA
jgi:hypothetical protein